MAEVQSWPRKTRMWRCSARAGGCWQRVPRSPRHPPESLGSWRQLGSPGQNEARPAGTRPAPSASIRSRDTGSPGTISVAQARLPLAPDIVFLTSLTL